MFTRSVSPQSAPDQAQPLEINFEQGNPVGINGQRLRPHTFLTALNEVAPFAAHAMHVTVIYMSACQQATCP